MRIASHRVAPSARAASRSAPGTVCSTSIAIEVMVGRIMIAITTPAARYPSPIGAPVKMGRCVRASSGSIGLRRIGTSTNSPHSP